MAWSKRLDPEGPEAGYATVMALIMSLAVTTIVIAFMVRSEAALRSQKRQLSATILSLALDGELTKAELGVLSSNGSGPFEWSEKDESETYQISAEPEWKKLGPAHAAALGDDTLALLRPRDAAQAKTRFADLFEQKDASSFAVAELDPSLKWRACAPRLLSRYGGASQMKIEAPTGLQPGSPTARVGQVWRIVIIAPKSGRRLEEYIRFTGLASRPADTIDRQLVPLLEISCQDLISTSA